MKKLTLISNEQRRSDSFDNEEVRWWWYGIRGRACESGWSVCDSIQKVPSVRHLGESYGGRPHLRCPRIKTFCDLPPWLSLRCLTLGTFCILSQTLQPLSHALPLIPYHHHLTSSSSRVTSTLLITYQSKFLHKLIIIACRISTIQWQTNE